MFCSKQSKPILSGKPEASIILYANKTELVLLFPNTSGSRSQLPYLELHGEKVNK
ncbi:hypothetical protein DPMN_001172 [Dreissena polymorpha]|uniref:Uncharacterized protein n=1 Tax=Dreissena polymorpha TaxID=45954 RepID=A0A9D4MJT1_DREPO|nr:hypothetical protein DPMN_001172 [Dreissena polymorpha]